MNKIFHIGDKVYPVRIDGSECNATKLEMNYLYGVVVGLSDGLSDDDRRYSVEWLDERTNEPAEFDHGLKNSWFKCEELTCSIVDYMSLLDKMSFKEDGEVLDEIVDRLCDMVDDELGCLCEEYDIDPCEYADTIIERLCERLK